MKVIVARDSEDEIQVKDLKVGDGFYYRNHLYLICENNNIVNLTTGKYVFFDPETVIEFRIRSIKAII